MPIRLVFIILFFVATTGWQTFAISGAVCSRVTAIVFRAESFERGPTYRDPETGETKPFFRGLWEERSSHTDPANWLKKGQSPELAVEIKRHEDKASKLRKNKSLADMDQQIIKKAQKIYETEKMLEQDPANKMYEAQLKTLNDEYNSLVKKMNDAYPDYQANQRELGELRFYREFAQLHDQGYIELVRTRMEGKEFDDWFESLGNEGPADPDSPATFIRLKKPLHIARGWGGGSGEIGAWFFGMRADYIRQIVATQIHATGTTAQTYNTYEKWTRFVVPEGSTLFMSPAGPVAEGKYRASPGAGGVIQFYTGRWNPKLRRIEFPVFDAEGRFCSWEPQPESPYPLRRVDGLLTNQKEFARPMLNLQSRIREILFEGQRLKHPDHPYDPRIHERDPNDPNKPWDRTTLVFQNWRDGSNFDSYSADHAKLLNELGTLRRNLLNQTAGADPETIQRVNDDLARLQAELVLLKPK